MPRKLLVADDSLTIQKVVELTFSNGDYQLTCVANGRLALEKVLQDPPDLILADVVMPEKNGYEVCEAIKRNPATAGIPVILLAGTFEPFDRERAERLGCDAIVSKPFDSHQLFRKVEELLANRGEVIVSTNPAPAPAPRRETPVFTPVPPSPFQSGFADEDFTGSIRNPRAGSGEAFASLYGPEDVAPSSVRRGRRTRSRPRLSSSPRQCPTSGTTPLPPLRLRPLTPSLSAQAGRGITTCPRSRRHRTPALGSSPIPRSSDSPRGSRPRSWNACPTESFGKSRGKSCRKWRSSSSERESESSRAAQSRRRAADILRGLAIAARF